MLCVESITKPPMVGPSTNPPSSTPLMRPSRWPISLGSDMVMAMAFDDGLYTLFERPTTALDTTSITRLEEAANIRLPSTARPRPTSIRVLAWPRSAKGARNNTPRRLNRNPVPAIRPSPASLKW